MRRSEKQFVRAEEILQRSSQTPADRLIDLLFAFGDPALAQVNRRSFRTLSAYYSALSRLRRAGLVITAGKNGRTPNLVLTDAGRKRISDTLRPQPFWNRPWAGSWYVVAYDFPEKDRTYRDTLRRFLSGKRMGCLQLSLWLSPDDIRSDFRDLMTAADVHDYAVLLSCSNALGLAPKDIVARAWPMNRLHEAQAAYCEEWESWLQSDPHPNERKDPESVANREFADYLAAMRRDPLLPRALWPAGYLGEKAFALHNKLLDRMRELAAARATA